MAALLVDLDDACTPWRPGVPDVLAVGLTGDGALGVVLQYRISGLRVMMRENQEDGDA